MDSFRTITATRQGIVPATGNLRNLKGMDMGMGITLFQFIRPTIDLNRFDAAVRKAVRSPMEKKDCARVSTLLKQLHCPLSKVEKQLVCNNLAGLRGKRDFLELVTNNGRNDLLLIIKSGCPLLSNKIAIGPGTPQEKFADFALLDKLAKESRRSLLSRILKIYTEDAHIEESCYGSSSWRLNFLDLPSQCAYFGLQWCQRGKYYPFLAGMSHGLYLIENDGSYEREGMVPICRARLSQGTYQIPLTTVERETKGIYCVRNQERVRFLDNMYESLTDALPDLEWVPHRKYLPIYNFRICDIK